MPFVTLVLSVHGQDTLWVVVDRRLSYEARPPRDDAVKVMSLETTDGVGLFAYAGLGATARDTEPSEWMSAVLRGRGGLTLERAVQILSDAANKELTTHLKDLGGPHLIIISAFVRGFGPRLYCIDKGATAAPAYCYTVEPWAKPRVLSPRIALTGTGGTHLHKTREEWQRALLGLVNAHDRGKVSDYAIADELARRNYEAHKKASKTVGRQCIVVWRRRPDARQPRSGGGHQFYSGLERQPDSGAIPTIVSAMDVKAINGVLMPEVQRIFGRLGLRAGAAALGEVDWNRLLADLPSGPDEKLR